MVSSLEASQIEIKALKSKIHSNTIATTKLINFEDPAVKKQIKKDELTYSINMTTFILTFGLLFYPKINVFFGIIMVNNLVLQIMRFLSYKKVGQHYYFWDYCYTVVLLMFYIMFYQPNNFYILSTFFILAIGPLGNAFTMFLYRIVYHDIDAYTSLYMHLTPCLAAWIIRFHVIKS